jgi:hypothetical protein
MAVIRGGEQFEDKMMDLAARVARPASLRVGFLENARYPDGKPVGMIAAIQEYGAPSRGIPPRPFFRNMIAAKQGEWPKAVQGLLEANNWDALVALDQAGAAIAGQLRQSIIETNEPPLAPSTIRSKGFSKPLIDTATMINSIDHEVTTS